VRVEPPRPCAPARRPARPPEGRDETTRAPRARSCGVRVTEPAVTACRAETVANAKAPILAGDVKIFSFHGAQAFSLAEVKESAREGTAKKT
jgi:hypothetical protein